jgi:nucleotide-binding universal stress UspA family protein
VLLLPPAGGGFDAAVVADTPLRVLVPLDGTPSGEAILPVLVRLGARLSLRATVLHVLPPTGAPDEAPLPGASLAVAALGKALLARRHLSWATAADYCRRVAAWLERHGVPAKVALRSGDAVEEIGRAALDLALDGGALLALGLPEALPWRFGYSAERILRSTPIPVLQLRSTRLEHVAPLDDTPAVPLAELLTATG